ncbi:hypothetical protein ACH5BK_04580 [Arcobacter sp. YIC-80]|uniref:hypothetical protein n=1 Tax=Arcobacter sp. YIC-80 TaxID=3376683 RepID=UPI00384E7FD2
MISFSNKEIKAFSKIAILILFIYIVSFLAIKATSYYQTQMKKERLTLELRDKKIEFTKLRNEVKKVKEQTQKIKDSYISQDELSKRVTKIFERMSIFDYNLKYLSSKKLCIDRYIIIAQLTANSDKGREAGEGILSYLGKIKKSETSDTLYYIDYVASPKD